MGLYGLCSCERKAAINLNLNDIQRDTRVINAYALRSSTSVANRRSSEIQGTALGKCLQAWSCIYRSMPAGVAQSRHAFVGGSVSTWAR